MKLLATLFVLLLPYTCLGQSNEQIAEHYFEAYQNLDFDELAKFYDDEAVFTDPTFYIINPDGFHIVGKDNIISTLKKGFMGTLTWKLDFKVKFAAGNYVVVAGNINSKVKGEVWGRPDKKELNFNHSFTTILQFKDKKVKEHRDYIDYITAGKQLGSQ